MVELYGYGSILAYHGLQHAACMQRAVLGGGHLHAIIYYEYAIMHAVQDIQKPWTCHYAQGVLS
jgi:hypothetical protein